MIEGFLLGALATTCFTAALFFLRFWKETRDLFFLAFASFFVMEGLNRTALLFFANPSEGSPWIYSIRLVGLLLILGAVIWKNYSGAR